MTSFLKLTLDSFPGRHNRFALTKVCFGGAKVLTPSFLTKIEGVKI